ncbi:MAG: hypothetical protein L0G95_10560 [Planococcus sp. (in: firmicutes)]|nr:hypothetical protein [Planococcus sp. (in: firmicutes)]
MENQTFVIWDGQTVSLTWQPYKQLHASDIVTSVHGYCFLDEKLVLVQVKGRGFNVPGGHVEKGDHSKNEEFTENGKYPKVGYQLFYRMDITKCFPFCVNSRPPPVFG